MNKTEQLEAIQRQLAHGVEELVSGERWRAMLDTAAKFHRYSAGNVLLIMLQRPDATRVAGYKRWNALGRQVRRGERGIAILAPCVQRRRELTDDEAEANPTLATVLRGFTVAHVFDVGQTEGAELPDVAPVLLAGDGPAGLWDVLAAQVAAAGYRLERGDCGSANGRTDFGSRLVTVRADVDDAQAAKTLAHELSHVILHDASRVSADRDLAEIEAESVAYVVCHAAGLTSSDYSFPYVARWAAGDLAKVRATAERVVTAARRIIDAMSTDAEAAA